MTNIRWTPVGILQLTSLWNEGMSIKGIVRETGRSRSAILAKRRELGLKSRRHPGNKNLASVYLKDDLFRAVRQAAARRSTSFAEYIRVLIRRDLGIT